MFNVGGLGIDNIIKMKLLSKLEFEKSINFKLKDKSFLVTFHPTTLENSSAEVQFQELLDSFAEFSDTTIIFTKANSDTDGRIINQMIDDYVAHNKDRCVALYFLRSNWRGIYLF